MNIYLIADGDEHKCWQAESMALAVEASENAYIGTLDSGLTHEEYKGEREYYRDSLLEQCTLIGELANPDLQHLTEAK